jgi:hypothetical protein
MSYVSSVPPSDPEQLPGYIHQELMSITGALSQLQDGRYTVLYHPPPRFIPGTVVYADGTSWDPGSGEGLYRYSLAGSWIFIG